MFQLVLRHLTIAESKEATKESCQDTEPATVLAGGTSYDDAGGDTSHMSLELRRSL